MNEEILILTIYNRLPSQEEVESGVASEELMIDSIIFADNESYNNFFNGTQANDLDMEVKAVHNINLQGYIVGD